MTADIPLTDLSLEREVRQALARWELISHGSITAYNSSGGQSGEPDDRMVSQVMRHEEPPYLMWKRLFTDARDDEQRRVLLAACREELDQVTGRGTTVTTVKGLSEAEILTEQIIDAVGWSPEEISRRRKCNAKKVREVRLANARHPETGTRLEDLSLTEQQAKAMELATAGLTQVQIAHRMGITQPRVSQLLKFQRPKQEAA